VTQLLPHPGFGPTTIHTPTRRHRRRLLVAALLVAALATAAVVRYLLDDSERDYLSTNGWPSIGQGAYQLGDGTPAASAHEQPAPIASVAKVMTALIVLAHRPLAPGRSGPRLTVSDLDVADTAARRARDESLVPVRAGEQLTERDALMALMLPSANNVAAMLARFVSGSVPAFVTEMNDRAHALGMKHTTYTDPSGFDDATVSTAVDQLLLAKVAARDETLTEIMATPSYRLPVAGTVHNTDTLLGTDGFVGMKTGSDDAAGGCFMFRSFRSVDGHSVELVGVVLGQHGHSLIKAGLYAAKQLVDRVAPHPTHA
jgi:serine-type D-Ala-D-Ala carboxypeptidase (penicillin-binding protein 5/6)